jgi:hypothetical protein
MAAAGWSAATIAGVAEGLKPWPNPMAAFFSFPNRLAAVLMAIGVAAITQLQLPGVAQTWGGADGTVRIQWMAPARQSLAIQQQLGFRGSVTADTSTQTDSRSPATRFNLAGEVGIDQLAKALLAAYGDEQFGAIVLRRESNGELLISNDSGMPAGSIVVDRAAHGAIILNSRSKPGRQQVVEAIQSLLP